VDEVLVPRVALGEEDQVVVGLLARAARRGRALVVPGPRRDVRLDPDDRTDPRLLRLPGELEDAEEVPVIGDRERVLPVGRGAREHLVQPLGPVQERVRRVVVEVDEPRHRRRHRRHSHSIVPGGFEVTS
jgi:hypothetical protein